MKYTVTPVTKTDCDCPDCRAGRHLYGLHRWQDGQWQFVGVSLQSYTSADDCKQQPPVGNRSLNRGTTWEDGTPIVPPEPACQKERPSGTGGRVELARNAFAEVGGEVKRHWLR